MRPARFALASSVQQLPQQTPGITLTRNGRPPRLPLFPSPRPLPCPLPATHSLPRAPHHRTPRTSSPPPYSRPPRIRTTPARRHPLVRRRARVLHSLHLRRPLPRVLPNLRRRNRALYGQSRARGVLGHDLDRRRDGRAAPMGHGALDAVYPDGRGAR